MNKVTKTAFAACAGAVALTCAAIQPVKAADMPYMPQYGEPQYGAPQYGAPQYAPPPVAERYVEERYVYTEPAPVYRPPALVPIAPPVVAYESEPYYAPRRRVYVEPGYRPYRGDTYVARDRDYGYRRAWHDGGYRRW